MTSSVGGRRSRRFRFGVSIGVAGVVLSGVCGVWLGRDADQFWHRYDNYRPDTVATPALVAAGVAFAGMAEPDGLTATELFHSVPMDEIWQITWRGSAAAVDQFIASAQIAAVPTRCFSIPSVPPDGIAVDVKDCRAVHGSWRQPDGDWVGRTLTWGQASDGTVIVNLSATGP